MGFVLAALLAGQRPNTRPMVSEKAEATSTTPGFGERPSVDTRTPITARVAQLSATRG